MRDILTEETYIMDLQKLNVASSGASLNKANEAKKEQKKEDTLSLFLNKGAGLNKAALEKNELVNEGSKNAHEQVSEKDQKKMDGMKEELRMIKDKITEQRMKKYKAQDEMNELKEKQQFIQSGIDQLKKSQRQAGNDQSLQDDITELKTKKYKILLKMDELKEKQQFTQKDLDRLKSTREGIKWRLNELEEQQTTKRFDVMN